jgi:hypothetical protein
MPPDNRNRCQLPFQSESSEANCLAGKFEELGLVGYWMHAM